MAVAGGKQSSRRTPTPDTHIPQRPQHPHDSCLFAFPFPFPFTFPFAFLLSGAATLRRCSDAMFLPVAKWRLRRANKMAEASTEVAFRNTPNKLQVI